MKYRRTRSVANHGARAAFSSLKWRIFRPGLHRKDTGVEIIIENPEEMNLLGLMLGSILETKIEDDGERKAIAGLRGDVGVTVGKQSVYISFGKETVRVSRDAPGRISATVSGPMKEFLEVSTGKNPVIPFLRGKFKIGGNPFLLLRMLQTMKI